MSSLINPFTIFVEARYTNPNPGTEYIMYLMTALIPMILIFIYNFAFNRMSNASFCNIRDIKCQSPISTPDPINPNSATIHCDPYDLSQREPESIKGLAVLNWSIFGLVAILLVLYITLGLTIGSGPSRLFYVGVGIGTVIMLYMLGAAIDTQVNKNPRRSVILAGISVMLIILSGLTVTGIDFGFSPIVLGALGLAVVIPTITTILSNKSLFDAGYVELPVFKGLANSIFSLNIVYLIYLIVAIGILYGKQGLTLDTLRVTDAALIIIVVFIVQIIIHSVFISKCSTPDYNCIPTLNTELSDGNLTYEQSCKLKTSNNMNLRASRIVLGVLAGIILIACLPSLIYSIKLTISNNEKPIYYIPAALACVAAILSYMNIWEHKLDDIVSDPTTTTTIATATTTTATTIPVNVPTLVL